MSTSTSAVLPVTFVPAPSLEDVKNGNAVLQKGHMGSAVSHVQQLLRISVDQKFGRDTETAVREFQQRNAAAAEPGMEGKVTRGLLAAMEALAAAQPQAQFDFDKRRRLDRVHPKLKETVIRLAARLAARNMSFLVTDGLRTFAEQDELFAQGRTKPGKKVTKARGGFSNHNYGLAIDSYPVISGRVFTEIPDGATQQFRKTFNAIQTAIGEEGEAVGLTWGGRWSDPFDPPHLQLFSQNEMNPSKCLEIYKANGNSIAAVWAEVDRRLS